MKKILTLSLLVTSVNLFAQVTGFKILNKNSTIVESLVTTINKDGKSESVFKTIDIIEYNYLDIQKASKNLTLQALYNELYNNSDGSDGGPLFTPDEKKGKYESIKLLEKDLTRIEEKQDSLYFLYTKDYLKHQRFNFLSFGSNKSRAFFDILYDNEGNRFKALSNSGINFGNNTGSIFSELVSGNLGLFRVSLGSMISNSTGNDPEAKEDEAYQRLVTYGGNTVLTFEYPLIYIHSRNSLYNFISRLIGKGTADLPAFGTDTEDWAGSSSLGIDFYADASLSNNLLRFYCNFNINKFYTTSTFKNNLGIENTDFTFGQLTVGLVFLENLKISFIVTSLSSENILQNRNVVAGGQVLK